MYIDTAIVIKLLVPEPESPFFQEALRGQLLSTSELAATEVWSALLAKERNGRFTERHRMAAWQEFQGRVQDRQIILHPLNSIVLRKAHQQLAHCHPAVPLRTLDAIHVATCDLSQDFPLCTTDRRMRDAAALLSIPIFPRPDGEALYPR